MSTYVSTDKNKNFTQANTRFSTGSYVKATHVNRDIYINKLCQPSPGYTHDPYLSVRHLLRT